MLPLVVHSVIHAVVVSGAVSCSIEVFLVMAAG